MNLISCSNCGIVLDKECLSFPEIYDNDSLEPIAGNSEWGDNGYTAVLPCPVCKVNIREDNSQ